MQKVGLDTQLWNISSECAKREWKAWVSEKDFISSVIVKIVVALGALKRPNQRARGDTNATSGEGNLTRAEANNGESSTTDSKADTTKREGNSTEEQNAER